MANERPVTGSCERCARGHDLLIPEPGSGDLDFQRIGVRFAWCAGCGRIVGRICCWDGTAGLCPDCAAQRAARDPSLTDVVLTRNALSGLSLATGSMDGLERRLRRLPVTDEDQARNGWEDGWLEAGVLTVRADGATETARRRGAAASVTTSDEQWLTDQLATSVGAWNERHRPVADRLQSVGLRIRALGSLTSPAAASAAPAPERQLMPVPISRTRSPVTHLPVPEPASVGARPPAPARIQAPAPPAPSREVGVPGRAPGPSGRRDAAARADGTADRSAAGGPPRPSPSPSIRPTQPAPAAQRVVFARRSTSARPAEPPLRTPRTPKPGRTVLARAPQPAQPVLPRAAETPRPSQRESEARSGGRVAVILLVALLSVIAAMVALAALDRPGRGAAPSSGPIGGAGTVPSPSAEATTAAAPGATAPAVTFDLEQLGPLSPEAAGIARVLGAPQVAALPTSFDRSLLLAAPGSGACLVGVRGEPARSLAIDLRTGTRTEGTISVTPTDRLDQGVAIDLALIAGLASETWYSIKVGWAGDGTISLDVRERDGGRSVHRAHLTAGTNGARSPGSGSVCVEALDASEATAVHLDNARVGS